ncbi:hypothetical protein GQ457_06G004830 [Hibiscus cannabinus]
MKILIVPISEERLGLTDQQIAISSAISILDFNYYKNLHQYTYMHRYIAAQLVAFFGQAPQSFTTSVAFSRKTPLVNFSGIFAPNAASFWRFFVQTPQLVNFSGVFAPNAASFVVRM